jgi:pimeloyl-ACP methyl ester carboxylesterase
MHPTPSNTTVVLIGDVGETNEVFETLESNLSKTNSKPVVLRYDRFGYGYSDSTKTPRHVNNLTTELEALLEQLKVIHEGKKVVVVGHGFGCFIARMLRDRYPNHVTSTVLVSPVHERMYTDEKEWFRGQVIDKLSGYTYTEALTRHGIMEPMLKWAPSYTNFSLLSSASPMSADRIKTHLLKSQYYGTIYNELVLSPISARQVADSRSKSVATSPVTVVEVDHEKDPLLNRVYYQLFFEPLPSGHTKQQLFLEDLMRLGPDSKLVRVNADHYEVLSRKELANIIQEIVNK